MRTKGAKGKKPAKEKITSMRIEEWKLNDYKEMAERFEMSLTELFQVGANLYIKQRLEEENAQQ